MRANQFCSLLFQQLPPAWNDVKSPPKTWADWTSFMTQHLHGVARQARMSCSCRHGHAAEQPDSIRRDLPFDFTWYGSTGLYALPDVVIEHENRPDERAFFFDLWKLMFACVPLRIMIGYCWNETGVEKRVQAIQETAGQYWHERYPQNAEDVILIGILHMKTPRGFQVVHRPLGQAEFKLMGLHL